MIINHNMNALNAHRMMTANTSASGRSMEKLSSGLRINRAGDDAAGLAISEKMRGQIRGLDQASRNAQDGISLIQTAEGALNETQSILQRMRELAVQASNDTNVEADRTEIQNEINQLTSEINRIGNTTEFNKQALLKGDIAISGDGRAVKAGTTTLGTGINAVSVDPNATVATGVYDVAVTSDTVAQIENTVLSNVTDASVTAGETVDLAGGAYKIAITAENTKQLDGAATDVNSILDTANGNTAITLESNSSLNDAAHTLSVEKEQIYSSIGGGLDIKAGTVNNVDSGTYTIETSRTIDAAQVTDNGADSLKADGVISNFTMAASATTAQAAAINNGTANSLTINVVDGGDATADITFTFNDGVTSSVVTLSGASGDGAQTVQVAGLQFDVDVDAIIAGLNLGDAVNDSGTYNGQVIDIASGAALDQVTVTKGANSDTKTIASNTNGDLVFDLDGGGADITLTSTGASFVSGNTLSTTVQSEYTISLKEGATQIGTDTVVTELELASNANALTNLSFGGSGALIDLSATALQGKVAGASYDVTFTVDTASGYTAELQKADGTAVDGAKYSLDAAALDNTTIDLGRDVVLTYDGADLSGSGEIYFGVNANVTEYTFELTNDGGGTTYDTQTVTAGETVEFSNGISLTTDAATLANSVNTTFEIENDEVDNSLSMQIGANKGQSFSVDISDMRSKALGISGDTASATADGVGTTAAGAKFVATENVSNGTDSAAVEFALDVSDHTNATAAVEVISQAIERVSSERSKLGAFQNRLEHTIANLGTSSENLTAAESRIRDVDMAKEMMSFSKNNILSQAAQAMLAQANQQPQGVLQLLR